MAKFENVLKILGHYKYLITVVVGVSLVGFLSETSLVKIIDMDMKKSDMQKEIDHYRNIAEESNKELQALKTDPKSVERVARERYFMKRDGEDVFVLSSDVPAIDEEANKKQITENATE